MLPKTTTRLLADLAEPGSDESWHEFDGHYRPVLEAFARGVGLNGDEAAEVAQETLSRVAQELRRQRYDSSAGRLRSWIMGIAKNCIADFRRQRNKRREQRGLSALADCEDLHTLTQVWDRECERVILSRALRQLREDTKLADRTIRAFELVAIEEKKPSEVAEALGMSRNEVYLAKHRCLSSLKEIVRSLRNLYELDGL